MWPHLITKDKVDVVSKLDSGVRVIIRIVWLTETNGSNCILTIMSLAEKETGHALNFYLVFLSERVRRVSEHKSNLNHRYQKSTISSINSQTWVNLQTQIALN